MSEPKIGKKEQTLLDVWEIERLVKEIERRQGVIRWEMGEIDKLLAEITRGAGSVEKTW